MRLEHDQRNELVEAILSAYPNESRLAQMLLTSPLDKNLDALVSPGPLDLRVLELIRRAEREGWVWRLITEAAAFVPGNQRLGAFRQRHTPAQDSDAAQPPGEAPFTVPFPRNPDFVGRQADLDGLHSLLTEKRAAGLTGMGGIGKTQLAVEYAYRHQADYPDGVFWINGAEPLAPSFARLGVLLRPQTAEGPPEQQVQAAFDELRGRRDALLVVDNLADPARLNQPIGLGCIPAGLPCRMLFTTRRRDLGRFRGAELTGLPEGPALQLLLRHESRQSALAPDHPAHEDARAIGRMLGGLPLALEVAGAFLGEWPDIPLGGFRARLRKDGSLATLDAEAGQLSPANLPAVHDAAVRVTLQAQWDTLRGDDGEKARLVLRVAGQFAEAAVLPADAIGLMAGAALAGDPGEPSAIDRAVKRLYNACLVEELRQGKMRLHPLVREFARRQTPEPEAAAFRLRCAANLAAAYEDCATLESEVRRRGVDALEEDLSTALGLFPSGGDPPDARLVGLLRVLRREANNLRRWDQARHPAFLAQQIHNRALALGARGLAESAARQLDRLASPFLKLRWRTQRESPELERTLIGGQRKVSPTVVAYGPERVLALTPQGDRAVLGSPDGTLRVWDLGTGAALYVLTGHTDEIEAVALTPSGDRAVTASRDRSLRVWDLGTGECLHTLQGHQGALTAVAVTPDGGRAISAAADGALGVWDLATGKCLRALSGHQGRVTAVAVMPDGHRAVSASWDQTLAVWDLATGECLLTLEGHEGAVTAVAVTPDGSRAVSASKDGFLGVWDLNTGAVVHAFKHEDQVAAVVIAPGDRAVSASWDHTLAVWDLGAGECLHTLEGHQGAVTAVAVTPDGHRAVSASVDHTMHVWDLRTGSALNVLFGHEGEVTAVAVTPSGDRAVSASVDGTLRIWDLGSAPVSRVPSGHWDRVTAVAVTPSGDWAVSASQDGTLLVWDLGTGTALHILEGHEDEVAAVAITPDGHRAVSASRDCHLRVWDLSTGACLHTLDGHGFIVEAVAVTPDGAWAVSGSKDDTLRVWDLSTGRALHVLVHPGGVEAVAITPGGDRAVSAGWDNKVRVWDLGTGQALHVLEGHGSFVKAVAITSRGDRAVSVALDHTVRVWDLGTGQALHVLEGHKNGGDATAVAITPSGDRAVSVAMDRTPRVWDLDAGRCLHALAGHEGAVKAVAVTSDGHRAVSASQDRTVRVWELKQGVELITLSLETVCTSMAWSPDGTVLVIGDGIGNLYCLQARW
jgi:WD40 repeat protein